MTIRFSTTSVLDSFIRDKSELANSTVMRNFYNQLASSFYQLLGSERRDSRDSKCGLCGVPELALTIGDAGIINYIQH